MFPVWAGLLALSGEVAAATWTCVTDFDCDPIQIAPNVDAESTYTDHAFPHVQTCYPCTGLTYVHSYTQQYHWLLWRAASHEHSGCGDGRAL